MDITTPISVADWLRLNRLLEQVLELEPGQRGAWLSTLSAESSDLRPLVEALLSKSESNLSDATSETVQPAALPATHVLAGMRREQTGDLVGPWQLDSLLAEGGMGSVWIARRADGVMQRAAALKLPRAEWIDRGLAERIARERSILAMLQHPHIAVLYDAGITAAGRPYLALEYVDGKPIDVECKGKPVDSILRLFVHVVRAVAYAHSRLVIHRDLKPSNVLVTGDSVPKLLDFGISKMLAGDGTAIDETALTRLAGRPLTLAYAAPEQVLGLPVSVAADVYSLGIVLYELLSGARPYRAKAARELEEEVLKGELPRPSDAAADPVRANALRGDLDAIVLKAVKRAADERYQSAAAFADDLERYLAGEPVHAQPDSRAYRLRKFITRNRMLVTAGGAVVLALAAGLGAALWQAEQARNQAERASALNTFVLSLIRQFDPRASQASKAADFALLAGIEKRIDAEFKGSADQMLQLRTAVGDAYQARGQHADAGRVYRRAIADAEAALPASHLGLLKARVARANFAGADHEALQSIDATIELLRQSGPAAIEPLVDALIARVASTSTIGRQPGMTWDSLYADAREAFDLAARHVGAGSTHHLRAAQTLAFNLTRHGGSKRTGEDRSAEALEVIDSAVMAAHRNPAIAEGNVDLLEAELRYGVLLCEFRSKDDAIRRFWNVVAIARGHHGDDSLVEELAFFHLADCLVDHGDPDGIWMRVRAYELHTARDQQSPWTLAYLAGTVARWQCDAGRGAECGEFVDKVLLHAAAMPPGKARSWRITTIRPTQVRALILRGKAEEAEALAARFLGEPDSVEDWLGIFRSEALRLSGRFDEAARAADAAIWIARAKGRGGGGLTWMLAQRGLAELEARQQAAALASAEQAMSTLGETAPWEVDRGVVPLAYGRALLVSGRSTEALEALRQSYGFWLAHAPTSVWAAEAEYWFGQAWIAKGDVKRGRWMIAEARRALASSPFALHRALAGSADAGSRESATETRTTR